MSVLSRRLARTRARIHQAVCCGRQQTEAGGGLETQDAWPPPQLGLCCFPGVSEPVSKTRPFLHEFTVQVFSVPTRNRHLNLLWRKIINPFGDVLKLMGPPQVNDNIFNTNSGASKLYI